MVEAYETNPCDLARIAVGKLVSQRTYYKGDDRKCVSPELWSAQMAQQHTDP